jgi:hypothetical protein
MSTVDYDLRYMMAGVDIFEEYLLSEDYYWPIGIRAGSGETPYPYLTLEGLLLSRQRLQDRSMSTDQWANYSRYTQKMDRLHLKWQVAWDKKAVKGFHSRFKMWGDYLSEYRDDAEGQADRYGYEVRLRVMLHLLQAGVKQQLMSEIGQLNTLDNSLRTWLMRSQFLWESALEISFPKETYWYLYGYLPGKLGKSVNRSG